MVRMRSAVRIRPAAPISIENFGFRCFFVAKMHFEDVFDDALAGFRVVARGVATLPAAV